MRPIRYSIVGFALAGCMGSFGSAPNDRFQQPSEGDHAVVPACPVDPDCGFTGTCDQYVCPDYWLCEDLSDGTKRCVNPGPRYPDNGGGWQCRDEGGTTVCQRNGTTIPDGGGGTEWNCMVQREFVVCSDNTPTFPDSGGGTVWSCYFSGEFRICQDDNGDGGGWVCYDNTGGQRECRDDTPDYPDNRNWDCYDNTATNTTECRGTGTIPDGGGGSEWSCVLQSEFVVCSRTPELPDGGGGSTWDCTFGDEFRVCREGPGDGGSDECTPGAQRWCDDAVFCSWGKQTCLPDGSWGSCIEPTVTHEGLADRPANDCGCRFFYFNAQCCEDQEDRNHDGQPDCIIPSAHVAPACATDGSVCSYCDSATDCGGGGNLCIFRRDGYAFCAQNCAETGCPGGYSCLAITTSAGVVNQCVPDSGTCG
jgi:hypothetical protein